jgi:abortive infection protein abiGII
MNKDSIVNKLRIRSSELNVSFNDVLSQFFYDEFLKLLSMSKYNENFLLKGGMLVAYKIGLQNRSTRDIDFLINGLDFNIENMRNIISDIVSMHTNEVWYELIGNWELIRLDDIYGGTRFHLIGHVSNIRLPFTLDIATGDPIYPTLKKEKYRTLLGDFIYLYFYSLESVVAEKLQTILARAEITQE